MLIMNSTFTGYQIISYRWNDYLYSVSYKIRAGSVVSTAVYRWDYISDEAIQEIQNTGCSSTAIQCADVSQLLRIFGDVIDTKYVSCDLQ